MGVWIEISEEIAEDAINEVAPFVGVWIEIRYQPCHLVSIQSLPSWECGLKFTVAKGEVGYLEVAPFVGVWIEILIQTVLTNAR